MEEIIAWSIDCIQINYIGEGFWQEVIQTGSEKANKIFTPDPFEFLPGQPHPSLKRLNHGLHDLGIGEFPIEGAQSIFVALSFVEAGCLLLSSSLPLTVGLSRRLQKRIRPWGEEINILIGLPCQAFDQNVDILSLSQGFSLYLLIHGLMDYLLWMFSFRQIRRKFFLQSHFKFMGFMANFLFSWFGQGALSCYGLFQACNGGLFVLERFELILKYFVVDLHLRFSSQGLTANFLVIISKATLPSSFEPAKNIPAFIPLHAILFPQLVLGGGKLIDAAAFGLGLQQARVLGYALYRLHVVQAFLFQHNLGQGGFRLLFRN